MEEIKKEPFYQATWFIVCMLIFFCPIGIVLMWVNRKFTCVARVIISVLAALILILSTLFMSFYVYNSFKEHTKPPLKLRTAADDKKIEDFFETLKKADNTTTASDTRGQQLLAYINDPLVIEYIDNSDATLEELSEIVDRDNGNYVFTESGKGEFDMKVAYMVSLCKDFQTLVIPVEHAAYEGHQELLASADSYLSGLFYLQSAIDMNNDYDFDLAVTYIDEGNLRVNNASALLTSR